MYIKDCSALDENDRNFVESYSISTIEESIWGRIFSAIQRNNRRSAAVITADDIAVQRQKMRYSRPHNFVTGE